MTKVLVGLSVLALLALLAGCTGSPLASATPTPPGKPCCFAIVGPPGQVIPWTPLTPNLTPPSPSLGPAPLPANTQPCQANELQGAVIGSQGATGHILTGFAFVGVGPDSCYLDGTPSVGLLDSSGQSISFRQQAPLVPTQQPGRALVDPGPVPKPHSALAVGQAGLTIDWVSQPEACLGSQPVVPAEALIGIAGGGVMAIAIPTEPAMYACQGLGVGTFETPYVPVYPSPPPALPAITMQVPSTSRVGIALPYLVTLTADRSQPYDFAFLCPTYEEELFADLVHGSPPLGGKHIYALNCGPAGVLQPGASVTFQMILLVPTDAKPGKYTLAFGLGYWNAMTTYVQAPVNLTL